MAEIGNVTVRVDAVITDEQYREAMGAVRAANERMDQLKSENAKLRELVRKVEHYERLGCHECPHADGCEAHTLYDEKCPMSREIERMKRELGIGDSDELMA